MSVVDLAQIPGLIPARATVLGLDYGSRHIGVAISDPGLSLATPLTTLERERFSVLLAALQELARDRNVGALILGLPLALDGTLSPAAQSVRTLASNITKAGWDIPVGLWDERFSTAVMQRELVEQADMSRARRAAVIDKLAATYILQGALDYWRLNPPETRA